MLTACLCSRSSLLGVLVVALIDIITRDEWQVKHLPKIVWILLVVLVPLVGTILWFAVGRDYDPAARPAPVPRGRATADAPTRPAPTSDARTTEQQLADLEREIEEARLRKEVERRRGGDE